MFSLFCVKIELSNFLFFMSKQIFKISLLLLLFLCLPLPMFHQSKPINSVSAQDLTPDLQIPISGVDFTPESDLNCVYKDGKKVSCEMPWLGQYIGGIYKYLIGAVGILAVVVMMFGGAMWVLSFGNSSHIGEAKAWIMASISGTVLALSAFTVLYLVNPDLTIFKPLNLAFIEKEEIEVVYGSGGGDLETAVADIKSGKNVTIYDDKLRAASSKYDIECTWLKAHLLQESRGNPNAKSRVGAMGLMQIMPNTVKDVNRIYKTKYTNADMSNPDANIMAGAAYLKAMYKNPCLDFKNEKTGKVHKHSPNCHGASSGSAPEDRIYSIAAYNGGYGANRSSLKEAGKTLWQTAEWKGYKETNKYVSLILGWHKMLEEKGFGC